MRFAIFLASLLFAVPAYAQSPNVIIVLTDDLGYGDVSANNPQSKISTPNIDAIAADGVRFIDGHSSSAVCSPSRYALHTGEDGWRGIPSGVVSDWEPPILSAGQFTVPGMMQDAGYDTAIFGKWHLGLNFTTTDGQAPTGANVDWSVPVTGGPNDFGYDYSLIWQQGLWLENGLAETTPVQKPPNLPFFDDDFWMRPGYSIESRQIELMDAAEEWLANRSPGTPFFMVVATTTPHLPIAPAARHPSQTASYGMYITELDQQIGALYALAPPNTLFIVASDNGGATMDGIDYKGDLNSLQNTWGHDSNALRRGRKGMIYEAGHRTPLIMTWPGQITPGTVLQHKSYFTQTDLCRTLARVVSATIPAGACKDSFDQTPLLFGWPVTDKVRDYTVNSAFNGAMSIRRISMDRKYIDTGGDGRGPITPGHQLYDLDADRWENNDLIATHYWEGLKATLDDVKSGQGLYDMAP